MVFRYRERDLRVIRPFVYVREKSLRQFAESRNLPVIPENCPACFEAPKVSTKHSAYYSPTWTCVNLIKGDLTKMIKNIAFIICNNPKYRLQIILLRL
jgi:hypothetical protein